tara:strand:- start:874 stop:1281 length:408 start_codon:yes stop_codon:yes gene_type:complete
VEFPYTQQLEKTPAQNTLFLESVSPESGRLLAPNGPNKLKKFCKRSSEITKTKRRPMNDQQIEKLTDIFRTLFNDPTLVLRDGLVATDVPGWDSFNHINLMVTIEEEFGVKFTNDEVTKMQNVGDLKNLLGKKLS